MISGQKAVLLLAIKPQNGMETKNSQKLAFEVEILALDTFSSSA